MDILQLKKDAKINLSGNRTPFVLGLLAFIGTMLVIILPFMISTIALANNPDSTGAALSGLATVIPTYLLILVFLIVFFPMCTMVFIKGIRTTAELPETENFTFKALMKGFKTAACGIGNYWWTYLCLCLWELLSCVPLFIFAVIAVFADLNINSSGAFGIVIIICYILVIFVILNRTIAYSMNWYFLSVNHNIGALEAMNKSKKITKGHKWELFLLSFSFIGWYLLSILTCGILLLWLIPYYHMSIYNAFKYLTDEYNKNSSEPIITPEVETGKEIEGNNPYFANDIGKSETTEAEAPENPENQE